NAQRRRFRACRAAVLEHLVACLPADGEALLPSAEAWVEAAPFDNRTHVALLGVLARHGRLRECEEHLRATASLYAAEELDVQPIRDAWRRLRGGPSAGLSGSPSGSPVPASPCPPGAPDAFPQGAADRAADATAGRASVAVMPFVDMGAGWSA